MEMEEKKGDSEGQFYNLTVDQALENLNSDLTTGLTQEEAEKRLKQYGYNELMKDEKETIWEKIVKQFEDTAIRILLASAIISYIISLFEKHEDEHSVPGWVEPCVIFAILILNGVVAIYQDLDAEKAIEALQKLQSPKALTNRDGKWQQIPAKNLVPGDIVQVSQGDKIPADLRMCQQLTITFKTDQAILTGESQPVDKIIDSLNLKGVTGILDKKNYLFSSTLVTNGQANCVVIKTGMDTEVGKIQQEVKEAKSEEKGTPLQEKLDEFGDLLAKVITIICAVCWLMNVPNFTDEMHETWYLGCMYYFKIAVALAVAAIPEGLSIVITTSLALGSRRLSKKKAIIRKLHSAETLGCTTVICSDKTGTLTTNEMCIKHFFVVNENKPQQLAEFKVEGESYSCEGNVSNLKEYLGKQKDLSKKQPFPKHFQYFCDSMVCCNDSKLLFDESIQKVTNSGLPTEAALKVLCEKIGFFDANFLNSIVSRDQKVEQYCEVLQNKYEKLATLEFTRDRKAMSVLLKEKETKKNIMFIKGAPDYLLNTAKQTLGNDGKPIALEQADKKVFESKIFEYAKMGFRTLAIGVKFDLGELSDYSGPQHKAHAKLQDIEHYSKLEKDLILIGIVALRDPPRKEVSHSIQKCMDAGISVIMITGDIKQTAESIAKDINIIKENQVNERSYTGHDFTQLSEEKQKEILEKIIKVPSGFVFSRTEPTHKRQLVKILKSLNQVVAMTGDGVNDAPALQQADIGIAMGITGTEVAKEASKMVLADDNFKTIVTAVEEGRAIYSNMKAFIRYMISSNIGEVVSIFITSLLGIPDGFNSIQLLWVNLVTDGLPATALSFNPPEPDVMKKPPRKSDEPIISGFVLVRYMIIGTYVGLSTVFVFMYWYMFYDWAGDGHQLVKWNHLKNWSECPGWDKNEFQVKDFGEYKFGSDPCLYFTWGKEKASTMSLTVLVTIEMFNAINALSDEGSLLTCGLFRNMFLLVAIMMSMLLHCVILYVPFLQNIFGTAALSYNDWLVVLVASFPVIIIDEVIKIFARQRTARQLKKRRQSIQLEKEKLD